MPSVPADRVAVTGMGIAVYAFQHFGDRQNRQRAFDEEPILEGGGAGRTLSAGATLGAPFCPTGRAIIAGAAGIDGGKRSLQFQIQSAGCAAEDRMESRAPISVFRAANASVGMGKVSGSARPAYHNP